MIHQKEAVSEYNGLPVIEGSTVLVYQLFYNLINNSLKFSKEGLAPDIEITSAIEKINGGKYRLRTDTDSRQRYWL